MGPVSSYGKKDPQYHQSQGSSTGTMSETSGALRKLRLSCSGTRLVLRELGEARGFPLRMEGVGRRKSEVG